MEKIKNIILLFVIGLLFLHCSDDAAIAYDLSIPNINVVEGNNLEVRVGETLNVSINISASTQLEKLEIYEDGSLIESVALEGQYAIMHAYTFIGDKNKAGVTNTYTFVAEDEFGVGASKSIKIYTLPEIPLSFLHVDACIFNANGTGPLAWDLVENVASTSTASVDLINSSTANNWVKGWRASSNTQFVKISAPASSFSMDTLTLEDITALFQEAPLVIENLTVDQGDYIVAKLRGTDEYAIIEIKGVDETIDNESEGIRFDYRKSSEFAGRN